MLNKPFYDVCQWLADENNIILTVYKAPPLTGEVGRGPDLVHLTRLMCQPYLNLEAQRFLFDERHIHPAVVRWLGLSSISSAVPMSSSLKGAWFNAPSLLIPYKDIEGKLVTVQARYLGNRSSLSSSSSSVPPRFQFPRGSICHIFNLPVLRLLKQGEDLQICEGSSDCMAALSSGVKSIAIPSATLLSHDDMRLLSSTVSSSSKLIIYPDQDDAGERLYDDLLHVANDLKLCLVRRDLPEGCKDFGDYWKKVNDVPGGHY